MRRLAQALVAGAVLLSAPATGRVAAAAEPPACTGFTAGREVGTVRDPDVVELSGIAASRAHPGVLWVHNDSGGEPELQALTDTGEPLGSYAVEGATAKDWEDIGIGPGPEAGRSYLYVGDIGDNNKERDHVTVYVVPEPSAAPDGKGGSLPVAETLTIRYEHGPANAEALFVDPLDGDLYIITKRLVGTSRVLRAPAADVRAGGDITMTDVGGFRAPDRTSGLALPAVMVTGADISPDGSTVLVRTYQWVLAFRRPPGGTVADAFAAPACAAPSEEEPQGEAVAFGADGSWYVTSSEGTARPIYRFGVDPPLRPGAGDPSTTTASSAPASSNAPPGGTDVVEDDSSTPWGPIVALMVVVGVVAAIAIGAVLFGRRGRRDGEPEGPG